MPDVKANYVFFGVDGYASENMSSPPQTMKIHMASPFSGSGMKCVEARPCSVGHGGFETLNVSIVLKKERNLLRSLQIDETEVRFVGST